MQRLIMQRLMIGAAACALGTGVLAQDAPGFDKSKPFAVQEVFANSVLVTSQDADFLCDLAEQSDRYILSNCKPFLGDAVPAIAATGDQTAGLADPVKVSDLPAPEPLPAIDDQAARDAIAVQIAALTPHHDRIAEAELLLQNISDFMGADDQAANSLRVEIEAEIAQAQAQIDARQTVIADAQDLMAKSQIVLAGAAAINDQFTAKLDAAHAIWLEGSRSSLIATAERGEIYCAGGTSAIQVNLLGKFSWTLFDMLEVYDIPEEDRKLVTAVFSYALPQHGRPFDNSHRAPYWVPLEAMKQDPEFAPVVEYVDATRQQLVEMVLQIYSSEIVDFQALLRPGAEADSQIIDIPSCQA